MNPLRRNETDPRAARILSAVEVLRSLDTEFPAQLLSALLYIASHDGCHKKAMEEDLNFTTASGSRNTDWLSPTHRLKNQRGLGLIDKVPDPDDGRMIQLELTPKGKALIHQLKSLIYD